MSEKKIKFTAEETVSPVIKRLRQESEQLGKDLIRDARSYTTSGKEAVRYIEDQIKAIERRNKADKDSRIASLDIARSKGGMSAQDYKKQATSINAEARVDQQQVTLLRELIETVKGSSRREIIEDRKNVEQQLKSDERLNELSPEGDAIEILKRSIQRDEVKRLKGEEGVVEEERRADRAGAELRAQRLIQSAEKVVGSSSGYEAVTGVADEIANALTAVNPIVGGVLKLGTSYASKAISASQPYEESLAGISRLTGRYQSSYYGRFSDLTDIGLAPDEGARRARETALARGTFGGAIGASRDISYLSAATGVDRSLLLQQERFTRSGGLGGAEGTENLIKTLRGGGMMRGGDTSLLGEYLPILINLQREQLEITGETNTTIATDLISGITSLDESFKNPEVLARVLPQVMGGLRNASTPQVQAAQFGILSRLNPNASLSELQMQQENPTAEYFAKSLDFIKGISPNKDLQIQTAKGFFGLKSTSIAEKIISGELSYGDMSDSMGFDVATRAGEDIGTGDIAKSTAKFSRHFQEVGIKMVDSIDNLSEFMTESFKNLTEALDETAKATRDLQKENARIAENMSNWAPGKAALMSPYIID